MTETPDAGNIFSYTLTVTPAGPYEIGAGPGESLVYTLNAVNTPEEETGSITLNKTGLDSTDTAGFTLYDSSGNPIGSEKTVTGNGSVSWTDLGWDTYKIVETTTPAGYTPIADITGIVIGSVQKVYSFDRVNTKTSELGSITLNKSGLDSTDTAGFTLYYPSGGPVGGERLITGNDTVTWSGLPFGTYTIVETTVPAGYSQMADITGITIGPAQLSFSFDRTNTTTPPPPPPPPGIEVLGIQELPFTGLNPIIPISGISIIIAGIVLLALSIVRRKKKGLEEIGS